MVRRGKEIPRLFFDIETTARADVEQWCQDPKIDSRIKDPVKIQAAKEEKIAEMIERAPLDPDLSTVRLISMQMGLSGKPVLVLIPRKKLKKTEIAHLTACCINQVTGAELLILEEVFAVEKFWQYYSMCSGLSVGFNHMSFDLPFLLRRSMELRIQPGITPNLIKYRTDPTTDLSMLMSNWDYTKGKRMKWWAKRYGLEILAEEKDGSMVADMTDEELIIYGLSDLHILTQLYRLMNGVYFNHMEATNE